MRILHLSLLLLLPFFRIEAQQQNPFEQEIKNLEQQDAANKPAQGQILLYGSSTMRLWSTFKTDLSGYSVINHGFGGSQMSDAIYFFDRAVLPLRPSLILLYEGDNDLSVGKKTPEQVFKDYKTFMDMVRKKLPDTKVAIYSLRPSLARESTMPLQQELNKKFKKYAKQHRKKAFYIDLYNTLLTPDGRPNGDYLVADKLHLNAKGYAVWTEATLNFLKNTIF